MALRRAFAFLAALFCLAAPLIVCLPTSSMTADEMACCRKMAGNCDMGGSHHKCCDTTANHPAPSTALAQATPIHDFSLVVIASSTPIDLVTLQQTQQPFVPEIQPSSSPPASPFILKN